MLLVNRNQNLMPALFNELFDLNNWNFRSEEQRYMPKMNVTESDKEYELELCVPGLGKEDLSLTVNSENNLVIEMLHKEEQEEKSEKNYLRREFKSMQFKQMLSLPENVKKEQISAKVENGILRVTLPKFTEEEKQALAQRIEIA